MRRWLRRGSCYVLIECCRPRGGLSLFIGICGGVAASAALGVALPYFLRMIRRDPQVASGPIALAAAEMITLVLYFNLGRWLLLRDRDRRRARARSSAIAQARAHAYADASIPELDQL